MAASEVAERAQSLREELTYHEHRYHVLEYPLVSSRRYWEMRRELSELEEKGVAIALDSSSLRTGRLARATLEIAPHRPQWPPAPALRSPSELRRYYELVLEREGPTPSFVGGARLTGPEVALTFENGLLTRAVLRGSGREGEDVTDNVRTIGTVPLSLRPPGTITESRVSRLTKQALGPSTMTPVPPFPGELIVRGVVSMRLFDALALDRGRIDSGEPPYVDAYAAVEASLRRFDPRVTASRRLVFFAYGLAKVPSGVDSHWQLLGALKSWGFRVMPLAWRLVGHEEVLDFISALQQSKPSFEYPLDGGVLNLGRVAEEEAGLPRTVLLAFATLGRRAKVPNVYRAVGRSGSVLPVALLGKVKDDDPPVPDGAPVPATSGSRLLEVKPGSIVRVLSGSVAPHIVLETPADALLPKAAESCSACGAALRQPIDEPFGHCDNPRCRGRARSRVLHLIGPRGLSLTALNSRNAEGLLGTTSSPLVEYFRLDPAAVERVLPSFGEAFRKEREPFRRLPLWRVLYLSAIPLVGERVSRAVSSFVQDVDGLMALAQRPEREIRGVPPEVQPHLHRWLEGEGRQVISALVEIGVQILGEEQCFSAPLLGKTIVIAGRLERMTSEQAVDEVERRGGRVDVAISRRTDLLIAGRDPGDAVAAAEAYGVLVIEEQALLGMLRLSA